MYTLVNNLFNPDFYIKKRKKLEPPVFSLNFLIKKFIPIIPFELSVNIKQYNFYSLNTYKNLNNFKSENKIIYLRFRKNEYEEYYINTFYYEVFYDPILKYYLIVLFGNDNPSVINEPKEEKYRIYIKEEYVNVLKSGYIKTFIYKLKKLFKFDTLIGF